MEAPFPFSSIYASVSSALASQWECLPGVGRLRGKSQVQALLGRWPSSNGVASARAFTLAVIAALTKALYSVKCSL